MLKLLILALVVLGAGLAQAAINAGNCGKPAIAPKECNTGCTRADLLMLAEFYRIVGGMEAKKGSWPWQAQLKVSGSHFCGGAIVNENTIVTASHCFNKYPSSGLWKVHVASHSKFAVDKTEKVFSVQRIIKHPKYSASSKDNDIAIVKVKGKISFTNDVSTVCVASAEPAVGSYVFVTGWGDTKGTGKASVLKQTMVPVVSRSTCKTKYSGQITNTMICAAYDKGGHDACQGDSGGPLVQKKGAQWYLYGVVSWGRGCADAKFPGVYANVASYKSWISQNS